MRRDPTGDAEERHRLDEELLGLDRDDPEVLEFSEHLARLHRQRPRFTYALTTPQRAA